MKYIERILSLVVCVMMVSWGGAQNCHISGRVAVPGLQGKNIAVMNMNTGKSVASTKIVDSTFAFDIEVVEPFVGMLKTEPQYPANANSYYYLRIIGEPGNIYADLVTDSLSGTPLNDQLYQFLQESHYEVSVINALYHQLNESVNTPKNERDDLNNKIEKRLGSLFSMIQETYQLNKTNALGAIVMEDYLTYDDPGYEKVMTMLEGAAPVVTTYQPLQTKLAKMEKLSHTAPGQHYIDLTLTDYKTGKNIKLSKVIDGKVALIDFWASWCGPCRREIPNIKKIHEKYGGKDFVVVGLNVWDKTENQTKAINDMGMTWTQITDFTRKATDTYGVDGIPQIMLIGKDGIIIARDLRGEEIEKAVKKALGK
jgi:thiol-disulfide isomerase/thioredoxin